MPSTPRPGSDAQCCSFARLATRPARSCRRPTCGVRWNSSNRHGFLVASDECYSELYFDENAPPAGLLQAAANAGNTAFERCIVFHSLSKRSSVPGPALRIRRRRSEISGGVPALSHVSRLCGAGADATGEHAGMGRRGTRRRESPAVSREIRARDTDRRDGACSKRSRSRRAGSTCGSTSVTTRRSLAGFFAEQHVTVLPGSYLARDTASGNPGRGRVRISLVASVADCVDGRRTHRRIPAQQPDTAMIVIKQ